VRFRDALLQLATIENASIGQEQKEKEKPHAIDTINPQL
jgi:hypothetical protein